MMDDFIIPDEDIILPATHDSVDIAATRLQEGKLVAFPTETVYGLGADATNDTAVAAIFEAKDRPEFNPLIIHCKDAGQAALQVDFDDRARKLADAFWPGALTLVLPRAEGSKVSLLASAGLDTLAVRVPDHPVAQALLDACERPLAAPSANKSGTVSPTQALHVALSLSEADNLTILDGGPCEIGIESTILDLSTDTPTLLRLGGVPQEEIEAVIGPVATATKSADGGVKAPGMLDRHYAPSIPIRINVPKDGRLKGESFLTFGPDAPRRAAINLSKKGDLKEAAANLFTMLRALDQPGIRGIAVMEIPNEGLGRAINDRLNRAAVPPTDSLSCPAANTGACGPDGCG